jgi:hypothetical protein
METADIILGLAAGYAGVGLGVALIAAFWGLGRIDSAAGSSWRVRLMLMPAMAILWPVVAWWMYTRPSRQGARP